GLMREYNARCRPPWSDRDLERKVREAGKRTEPRGRLKNAENPDRVEVPQYLQPGQVAPASGAPAGTRQFPRPPPLSELRHTASADRWLVHGLIARNAITLLTAFWKAGKTTALSHLFAAMENGGTWFGQKVEPCSGIIVSEEPEDLWADRRDMLDL